MILVALDGSPRAPAVLAKGVALARAQDERLILFRAIGLPTADVPRDLWKSTDRPLLEELEKRTRTYLEQCEALVPPGLLGGTHIRVGAPWEAICEMAASQRCDLIVLGSHGYSGFDRILGTTAAKVVNHASCSVLVVREPPGGAAV